MTLTLSTKRKARTYTKSKQNTKHSKFHKQCLVRVLNICVLFGFWILCFVLYSSQLFVGLV